MQTSADILGPDGPFQTLLPGFQSRDAQRQMAQHVEEAIAHNGTLIAESGTGTGKTFAYLVPALLSGKRVLISTGTKHLQDQLYARDIPLVRKALGVPGRVALLKGRANYLCLDRYARAQSSQNDLTPSQREQMESIVSWHTRTSRGDISEVAQVPEDASIWPLLTSTNENCLGAKCSVVDDCYVNRARRSALKADILVVNHHLFFADLALREEGFGKLLPGVDCVIFDEAHQLPAVATTFLGSSVSGTQVRELCRDIVAEELREKSQVAGLNARVRDVEHSISGLRLALGEAVRRLDWAELEDISGFQAALQTTIDSVGMLSDALREASVAGEGLTRCWSRCLDIHERLSNLADHIGGSDRIRWAETTARSFRLHETPLHIGKTLESYFSDPGKAWVFTSATLSVAGDFRHYQRQIGVGEVDTGRWASPFDFERQALLYIPEGLPDPRKQQYTGLVVDRALPVLEANRGRAFMLFTSYRALHAARGLLRANGAYQVLAQGEAPKTELLDQFRTTANSVLLGTTSFWEGVDVRGEALSCVIIDKLPFEAPDDPVLRARIRAIEDGGGNPFMDYQLPNAVITLNQGFGRLIRDVNDRGVLMLCDPRVLERSYGKLFLRSLPPMRVTRTLHDVQQFLASGVFDEH